MALDSEDLLVVQKNTDGALYSLKVGDLPQSDLTGDFVEVDGDNMTGDLTLGTDKITLGVDGSAAFTGLVNIGDSGADPEGHTLYTNGVHYSRRSGDNQAIYRGYTTGNPSPQLELRNNGSATFAANGIGVNFGDFDVSTGHVFFAGGAYKVRRNDDDAAIQVFQNGTTTGDIKAEIKANGTATFTDKITTGDTTGRGQFLGTCPSSVTASSADGLYCSIRWC